MYVCMHACMYVCKANPTSWPACCQPAPPVSRQLTPHDNALPNQSGEVCDTGGRLQDSQHRLRGSSGSRGETKRPRSAVVSPLQKNLTAPPNTPPTYDTDQISKRSDGRSAAQTHQLPPAHGSHTDTEVGGPSGPPRGGRSASAHCNPDTQPTDPVVKWQTEPRS